MSILLMLALLLGIVVGWIAWGGATIQHSGEITIEEGTAAIKVWEKLANKRFTWRTLPWRYYAWREGTASKIKAGKYHLEKGEAVRTVIRRFVAGDILPDEFTITYPEGFTIEQMAARTANRGIGTVEEFKVAAADVSKYQPTYPYLKEITGNRALEGYLFPDTYRVADNDTSADVVQRMVATFNNRFTDELQQEAFAKKRTIDQIVIMASIIEREVISDEDMAVVSGVLWKRFDEEIGLDADATIRFALNKWDGVLTAQDLAIDSPYNTRKYRGLPPGPISNPGTRALMAAIRPQESDYYYYLSTSEGDTIFSKTNSEHNQNKAKYLR